MLYPFMTLNDNTEIVHSEILENSGKEEVEVRIEKPVQGGFYSATCWLPEYRWENIQGFSQVNENNPLEPVQVHIAKGVPSPNATKIWITKSGKCLLCHNNSKIPDKQLRIIMQIIEARNKSVIDLWYSTFREIRFYC